MLPYIAYMDPMGDIFWASVDASTFIDQAALGLTICCQTKHTKLLT